MSPKYQVIAEDLCKLIVFLLFGFFVTPYFASATTVIPDINSGGYFTNDVVWTKADSPYVVTSAIFANTSSLTIEPGTIIKFNPGYGILVRGRLEVGSSTSTDKVYFTSIKDDTVGGDTNNDATSTLPRAGDWGGFNFAGPDGVVGSIENAVFRYGGSGGLSAAMIVPYGGNIVISNSQIMFSSSVAIRQSAGIVKIINSEIKNRCGGIRFSGGALEITGSSILEDLNSTSWCFFGLQGIDNRSSYIPVVATNNWWGSPSGPRHSSNPDGTGTAISGNINFTPWLTSDPFDTTTCTQDCFSNVLFLPGLEASRLYKPDYNGGIDQLWEPNANSDAVDLFLDADGKSTRSDVYTKDVIDEKNVLPFGQGNIYKSFLSEMKTWESAYGITATTTPYDWRLSLDDIVNNGTKTGENISYLTATSSPYIVQELRNLAKTSKTGKVTIVAHSNGGLVAKALMQKLGDLETAKLVDKIIFIAVPQAGTPQAVGAVLHGYDQGLPFDFAPLILTPQTARTLAENMPSAYNMLPSVNYFNSISTPVVTFEDKPILVEFRARYGNEIRDGAQLKYFITDTWRTASSTPSDLIYPSVGNTTLLSNAEVVHDTLDNWTPPKGVSLYEIAGWGEDTLATIEYKDGKKTVCKETQPTFPFTKTYCTYISTPTIIYNPKEVIDGDGTVATPSALWNTASTTKRYWVDLGKYNNELPQSLVHLDSKHANILEVPDLSTLIHRVIVNSTSTLSALTFVTDYEPTSDVATNRRISFVLHSPLNISATDNLGNIISFATSTIPGAHFTRYGEVQVIKIPKGTPITLNLDGYASGSFTLDVEELNGINTVVASTTFSAVPSATSTTATISFPDGTLQTATPLFVDYDGNGTNDFTLRPNIGNEIVFDTTPPEARILFSTTTQKLLVEGIDEGGETTVSNIATSSVVTDLTGNTLGIVFSTLKQEGRELNAQVQGLYYNGAFTSTIPKTTLQYEWSIDKNGNLKEFQQKATVGTIKVEAHYDAQKNITNIKKEIYEGKDNKETFSGLRILKLVSDKGSVGIDY